MKWLESERILKKTGQKIFTNTDLERILGLSTIAVRFFTYRNVKRKLIVRLKKGVYALSDNLPGELEIANRLYTPSYLSFEYALGYYQIIPEAVYSLTSATTKPTRHFQCMNSIFTYHTIHKRLFCGYAPLKINHITILMADPEKALLDYLYFQYLKKKPPLDRFELSQCSRKKITQYAEIFNIKEIFILIEGLL